ncbi:ArsR/SmtB family transcription factor [Dyadobacter psychrotolerans]|uniref:ArsR family transcriptional regulator n=1 Tax=Dyadobacter psychrotolerans TaxID=2541721 RepID=A0A4R5DPY2_9BACT|nr:metalloregulator ArsR/SmtB family transcription factor [Dyadobacter psychrotolerans]TDE12843.1 ArsR family transcriptional regulator [Dyadobacter psychrotolerans]
MDVRKVERISKALSDPSRIAMLQQLAQKENCLYCHEISDFVDLSQPSISHHVKQLSDADLILVEKEGRQVKYKLNKTVLDEYVAFLNGLKI